MTLKIDELFNPNFLLQTKNPTFRVPTTLCSAFVACWKPAPINPNDPLLLLSETTVEFDAVSKSPWSGFDVSYGFKR